MQHGQVQSYDAERGRYAVRLDNGILLSVKASNLCAFAAEPKDDLPDELVCCITKELMRQPVITTDGHTYDRHAIREWLERRGTSPKTGQELSDLTLRPNHALRAQIIRYREEHNLEPLPPWEPDPQEVVVPSRDQQSAEIADAASPGRNVLDMLIPHGHGHGMGPGNRTIQINGQALKDVVTVAFTHLPELRAELQATLRDRTGAVPDPQELVDAVLSAPPLMHRVMQAIERHPELRQVLGQALQEGLGSPLREGGPAEPSLFACIRAGAVTAVEALLPPDAASVRTPNGDSLLHIAAWEGERDVVILLLARRLDPTVLSRNRSTALHYACWNGHAGVAGVLLDAKVGIEQRQEQGDTALVQAAFRGSSQCVRLLLERRADVNAAKNDGDTALHFAAHLRLKETMDMLLAAGAQVNLLNERRWTPLRGACFAGFKEGVRVLLDSRSDPQLAGSDGEAPLHAACHHSAKIASEMVSWLLEAKAEATASRGEDGFTPLHLAAGHGSEELVQLILPALDGQVDLPTPEKRLTPLHVAALCQRDNCVSELLRAKAGLGTRDHLGFTALHHSLRKCSGITPRNPPGVAPAGPARFGGATQLLVSAGSDVDARASEGYAPIFIAVINDRHAGLAMLLQARADMESRSAAGDTALHVAARQGYLQCVEMLLRHSCDIEARNGAWFTPEDVARQANHALIVQMLQDRHRSSAAAAAKEADEVA